MTAQVTNPRGKTEDAEIVDLSGYRYVVRFLPTMPGVHTISVKSRGIHVPGESVMSNQTTKYRPLNNLFFNDEVRATSDESSSRLTY